MYSCRDTPHHLKNKRVHHGVTDKVANMIIANALKNQENQSRIIEPLIENEAAEELKEGKCIVISFFILFIKYLNIKIDYSY